MTARFVDVATLGPVPDLLTYALPSAWQGQVVPGMRVLVPLGKRLVTGCVVALRESALVDAPKSIVELLDERPALTAELIALTQWMADYYLTSWGEAIRAALPGVLQAESVQTATLTPEGRLPTACDGRPPLQLRILTLLAQRRALTVKQLQRQIPATGLRSALQRLAGEGLVELQQAVAPPRRPPLREPSVELALPPSEVRAHLPTLERRAPQQAALLRYLLETGSCSAVELRRQAAYASQVLRALEQKGLLKRTLQERPSEFTWETDSALLDAPIVTLSPAQSNAFQRICGLLRRDAFAPVLLHGVTGSGKTEVYMQAMAETLAQGKQVIYLVPEISLTPQLLARVHARFGQTVAVLHSRLTSGERMDEWARVRAQQASVVIGPRSAIFAPLEHLGLIVVDEEHDPSYKQEETPRYLARDVAIMRAKLANAVVVLGSATPSLESFFNAKLGRYQYLQLPDRIQPTGMPAVVIVDLRREEHRAGPGEVLSFPLRSAITTRLARGEQILLFLNRRGYATFVQCHDCGFIHQCPRCSVALTFHLDERLLKCHYCGFSNRPPECCDQCRGTRVEYFGTGTQRVEREVRRVFPEARISRMDRDATGGRHAYQRILGGLARGEIDILVGTQMIAKGHDFPRITLVGVVSADITLGLPDFRAAERTFQLLTQVAGRAGRGDTPGEVFVQTYAPQHYAVQRAQTHDFIGFYTEEITYRRQLGYPPVARLAAVRFDARDPQAVEQFSQAYANLLRPYLQQTDGVAMLGPAPAALAKLKDRYRWHLLLKAPTARGLHQLLEQGSDALRRAEVPRNGVHLSIDVDPVNLL